MYHDIGSKPIVIPYEEGDDLIHTDEQPVCDDETCPCHLTTLEEAWDALQAVPSYFERDTSHEE